MSPRLFLLALCLGTAIAADPIQPRKAEAPASGLSHPPMRPLPEPSNRPLPSDALRFVDPRMGDDSQLGSKERPWRTIAHALPLLSAGDTLVLRGGVYYETIRCSLSRTLEKPSTIRSAPGERATVDGGFRE